MQKLFVKTGPYAAVAGLYMVAMLLLRLVETFLMGPLALLPKVLTYNLIVISWTILALLLVYLLIDCLSRRAAVVTVASILALLFVAEVGLTLYYLHNGFLLGAELFARPLSESVDAIRGAMGIVLPLLIIVAVLVLFVLLSIWLSTRRWRWTPLFLLLAVLMAILSLLFPVSHLVDLRHKGAILNKTYYLMSESWKDWHRDNDAEERAVPYDASQIAALLESHPEWNPIDPRYPLEREDNTEDVLAEYFRSSDTLPNVVLIVVESLGAEFVGNGTMPFFDSLTSNSLYWSNCLSTTMRSYGVLPAVTGSVGGPKCFQFGKMPAHNSLISILHNAGYHTQSFYAGNYAFDCVYDYLQAEHIDYMSPYYNELMEHRSDTLGSWWGYHDHVMLQRVGAHLATQQVDQPQFSLIVTLSMHEDLDLGSADATQKYIDAVRGIGEEQYLRRYAAARYTDECLRKFFDRYRQRPEYNNTIFVVTGDHAPGLRKDFKLDFHHVPLVIYSPLLNRHAQFDYFVTHNDVAPSLCRLLADRYALPMPPTVHWLGNGLANSPKTMLIVGYDRKIEELVWNGYYYQTGNQWEPEAAYRMGPGWKFIPTTDAEVISQCREQLALLKYLYSYTYYSDRLTQHPIYHSGQYALFRDYWCASPIECQTPTQPPSKVSPQRYNLLPQTTVKYRQGYSSLRINFTADVLIQDSLWFDEYMDLEFEFDNGTRIVETDKIVKYFAESVIHPDSSYHIALSKEFPLSGHHDNTVSVSVVTPAYDDQWVAGTRLTVNNAHFVLECSK